jgi:2-isopropylmalate synthase
LIESRDGQQSWTTIGVSPNLMEASWMAIIDSVLYKLLFASREGKSKKAPGARIQKSEVSTSS